MAPMDAVTRTPEPINEPILQYPPGSAERGELEAALKDLASSPHELTSAIGGKRVMAPAIVVRARSSWQRAAWPRR